MKQDGEDDSSDVDGSTEGIDDAEGMEEDMKGVGEESKRSGGDVNM